VSFLPVGLEKVLAAPSNKPKIKYGIHMYTHTAYMYMYTKWAVVPQRLLAARVLFLSVFLGLYGPLSHLSSADRGV
jgi:hypothetical protein